MGPQVNFFIFQPELAADIVAMKQNGIFGYAKKVKDGTVEIVAEGDKEKLEEFLSWCKQGPEHAKIEKAEAKWYNKKEDYKNFKII